MPLSIPQQNKVDQILSALVEVVESYNNCQNLMLKIDRVGNDDDVSLTPTQIQKLIDKYMILRTSLISATNALPTIP